MSKKRNVFRMSMVTSAQLAAESMRDTPIASKLKANGFTHATMAKEANELSALRTQVQAAKAALVQASAALGARSEEFAAVWASYSNLVRALTTDEALRRKHGVKSPGVRKGPMFRRATRSSGSPVETPVTSTTTTTTNGAAVKPSVIVAPTAS
jgi:hypothetical protein